MYNEIAKLEEVYSKLSELVPLPASATPLTINSLYYWQGNLDGAVDAKKVANTGITAFLVHVGNENAIEAMPYQQHIKFDMILEVWLITNVKQKNYQDSATLDAPQIRLLKASELVFDKFKNVPNMLVGTPLTAPWSDLDELLGYKMQITVKDIATD